ncbi:MAG: histidinol-phosphate transaminase [Chitinophagaceae bacterium]|nr:histidinol-phosphate transaminase [Chitinophagaceae bacterium]
MNFNINNLIRENIKKLLPYSSARDEFSGEAKVFLDANENSLGSPTTKWYNRYPDPHQTKIKQKLSLIKHVPVENIFIGNGSDECIDLLYRIFCEPGRDNVIICPPTYGMYEVSAHINDVELRKVPLLENFQLDMEGLENHIDGFTKIIWLCSPNNPTANSLDREDIRNILENFHGIVVIDEAYINFSRQRSFLPELNTYPNLVVLQTLSKAWGLAGLRLGMAFAGKEIIAAYNKIKPPYNIGQATQDLVLGALDRLSDVNEMIKILVKERGVLAEQLRSVGIVERVFPTDANFILVKVKDAKKIYDELLTRGIVVRDRSNVKLCEECLRITVGSPEENKTLLNCLRDLSTAL